MTTADAIARFEQEYLVYHGISTERRGQQVKLLRQFAGTLGGRSILEATASDLTTFAGALVESGLHVNTVRKKLNQIRPFVSWAYAVGLIDADRYLRLKEVKNPRGSSAYTTPKPYSTQEIRTWWRVLGERYPLVPESGRRSQALTRWLTGKGPWTRVRPHAQNLQLTAMTRLTLDLGLRRSEIYALPLDDAHYDLEYLVVKGKADPNTGQPKIRQVPMTTAAREALRQWIEFRALIRPEHDQLWLGLARTPTSANPIRWDYFTSYPLKMIGPGYTWHRFRHTCATEWLRAGMNLEVVKELLGHATIHQTLAYAQILGSDVAKSMARSELEFSEAVGQAAA